MEKFTKYGRTMKFSSDSVWKQQAWINQDPLRQIISSNCHWGQLKLFYTEIEFITICIENGYKLSESTIVYVGAAPGTHTIYLRKLFPEVHWILIDPNPFHIKQDDHVDIITGPEGFFKDSMIPSLLNHYFIKNSKNLLFISDIRTETKEDVVFNEMLDQQRWLLKLNADISMLKFRLPYTIEKNGTNWSYTLDITKQKTVNVKNNMMYYLKGDIYMQLFAPQYSTETRLIIDKRKHKNKMFNYDTVKYESKCYYFNTTIRKKAMTYKSSNRLKNHVLGCMDNYETSSQYQIIERYFNAIKKKNGNIIELIYEIHNYHNTISTNIGGIKFNKSLAWCIMFTIYKEKLPNYNAFLYRIERNKLNKENIDKLIDSIKDIHKKFNEFNEYQINAFEKGTLLPKQAYARQISLLNEGIRANDFIYKQIMEYYNQYNS